MSRRDSELTTESLLVLGAGGQVGRALRDCAPARGVSPTFLDRSHLDITDRDAVARALRGARPGMVINAAAFTDVDGAERQPDCAFAVNRDGPANLADVCAGEGIPLIHLSTDFVFDGTSDRPYGEEAPVCPISVYGQSKAEGEEAVRARLDCHIIVRTSWLFSPYGRNFVKAILRRSGEGQDLCVVNDQTGGPTDAASVAQALIDLGTLVGRGREPWGVYHYCGAPAVSRFAFAEAILDADRRFRVRRPRLRAVTTSEYPTAARRPANAVLDCSRILREFGIGQPDWRPGLARVVEHCRGGCA